MLDLLYEVIQVNYCRSTLNFFLHIFSNSAWRLTQDRERTVQATRGNGHVPDRGGHARDDDDDDDDDDYSEVSSLVTANCRYA